MVFFFVFGHIACGILVSQPGIKPVSPPVKAESSFSFYGNIKKEKKLFV